MRSFAKLLSRAVFNDPSEAGGGASRVGREKVAAAVPLRLAGEGERVRIVALHGGRGFHDRLAGMGLCVGGRLEVIRNRFDGRIVLGHEGARLFLGGGMAQKIDVFIEGSNT
jgi:Fe2+ transport system protein FeoA